MTFKVGGVTSNQMSVYEEFAKSIPGFLPPDATGAPEPFPKPLQEPMPGIFGSSGQEGTVSLNFMLFITSHQPSCMLDFERSRNHRRL